MEGLKKFAWVSDREPVIRVTNWGETYTHALANQFGEEVAEYWGPRGGEVVITPDGHIWYRDYHAGE